MKIISMIALSVLIAASSFAQKKVIDTSDYQKFRVPIYSSISNDGQYVAYRAGSILYISAVNGQWKKQIANDCLFADNSTLAVYLRGKDSLCIQYLGSDKIEYITNVINFQTTRKGNAEYLLYRLKTAENEWILRNLATGKQQQFPGVTEFRFNNTETGLLLQQKDSDTTNSLKWVNLNDNSVRTVHCPTVDLNDAIFTADGTEIAFLTKKYKESSEIWYCDSKSNSARKLLSDPVEPGQSMKIDGITGFNSRGDKLFFSVKQIIDQPKLNPALASVDVYSYKDAKLQSQQLFEKANPGRNFTFVFNFSNNSVLRLERENESILGDIDSRQKQDFVLVRKNKGGDEMDEYNWNPSAIDDVYLESTSDGTRKCIARNQNFFLSPAAGLSPNDKYAVFYNAAKRNYFSYNIATGTCKNITKAAKDSWLYEGTEDEPDSANFPKGILGWLADDSAVLISSKNDIIEADPKGIEPAFSLTHDYGRTHHLVFDFVSFSNVVGQNTNIFSPRQSLLFRVTNEVNKDQGFCRIKAGDASGFELMKMRPYNIQGIQKARDAEVYTMVLSNAEQFPNAFLTNDLKTFRPLTDIHPEHSYYGLVSKLITWKTFDGKVTQGVLYKPGNFDPKRKYPVIFEYYERNLTDLHGFLHPEPDKTDGSRLNIFNYVNRGYLVFTPDIHYKVGYPGRSAYNSIISGANYLSQFPWVDKAHMGLMGHSFGGFETNYVITHSHRFAAAVSMSGMTDFVSAYGSIIGDGTSRQRQYEFGRDRIGATLWQRSDLYLENSPVLKADRVTTPVLMMANKKDGDVPYEQGFEFFTALRRLQKKAWLLQYDNGGHQVWDSADQKDLTVRMRQFFDYYLKGIAPPKWMVQGVRASLKQVDSGFEPDTTGGKP